jgi:hypothetical protein
MAVDATMKGSEVACNSPAATALRVPTLDRYNNAGTPRAANNASRKPDW